jgi:hypothetical protein
VEIQQDEVQAALAADLTQLRGLVLRAADIYQGDYPAHLRRSHLIHDHFVDLAAHYAENRSDVDLVEVNQFWILVYRAGYALSFKKLRRGRRSSGRLTGQRRRFRGQEALDGLPRMVNLELGYRTDIQGQVKDIFVVCPSGDDANMWEFRLDESGAVPNVVSLFGKKQPALQPDAGGTTISSKRSKRNETQSGDGNPGEGI